MQIWNVVVITTPGHYRQAIELLQEYGTVERTAYFNVLTMRVDDGQRLLEQLYQLAALLPHSLDCLTRLVPVSLGFRFQQPEEFRQQASALLGGWAGQLAGKRFHLRMHRRGFKGRLSSQQEERALTDHLLALLAQRGASAAVSFDDPEIIIAIETIGQRAGLSLWTRAQLQSYPLLKLVEAGHGTHGTGHDDADD